jgi:hypothetical protein
MLYSIKIECPACHWKPDGGSYWQCNCGHVWNTFETMAKCPACKKQWKVTQCPSESSSGCGRFHPHEDWYIIPIDFESLFQFEKNLKEK